MSNDVSHECSYVTIAVRELSREPVDETYVHAIAEEPRVQSWHNWAIDKGITATVEDLVCTQCEGKSIKLIHGDMRYDKRTVS
jgi:hypothetical protein